jgi:hypothetical protein
VVEAASKRPHRTTDSPASLLPLAISIPFLVCDRCPETHRSLSQAKAELLPSVARNLDLILSTSARCEFPFREGM